MLMDFIRNLGTSTIRYVSGMGLMTIFLVKTLMYALTPPFKVINLLKQDPFYRHTINISDSPYRRLYRNGFCPSGILQFEQARVSSLSRAIGGPFNNKRTGARAYRPYGDRKGRIGHNRRDRHYAHKQSDRRP